MPLCRQRQQESPEAADAPELDVPEADEVKAKDNEKQRRTRPGRKAKTKYEVKLGKIRKHLAHIGVGYPDWMRAIDSSQAARSKKAGSCGDGKHAELQSK